MSLTMMKSELEKILGRAVPPQHYEVIEQVYMFYDDRVDKSDFVDLYKIFGIKIFKDMYPRAMAIKEAQDHAHEARMLEQKAREREQDILEGADL